MSDLIKELGGTNEVARMCGVKPPSVTGWKGRIPPERRPAVEKERYPAYTVELLSEALGDTETAWRRVPDPAWPNPAGRPCLDVVATLARGKARAPQSSTHPPTLPAETPAPAASAAPGVPVTRDCRTGEATGHAPERTHPDKSQLKWPDCGERREHPPEVPGSGAYTRRKNPDLRKQEPAL
jgi:hypothetical protein